MALPDDGLQRRLDEAGPVSVRRDETPEDARQRRERERWLFFVALAGVVSLVLLAIIAVAILPDTDSRRILAERAIPAFLTGVVGYLFGKNAGR